MSTVAYRVPHQPIARGVHVDIQSGEGPYARASYVPKLQKKGIMVLTDLDGTLTSRGTNPSNRELSDRAAVRQLIDRQDVAAGAVTARTCGLTLSKRAFDESPELHMLEPPPRWHRHPLTGKHVQVDLSEVPHFHHCLDWDFAASFCSRIIVRNGHGYRVDTDFEVGLRYDYPSTVINPEPWRQAMMMFLGRNCGHLFNRMSMLEERKNYDRGDANVAPLEFRFQFDFYGPEGLAAMRELEEIVRQKAAERDPLAMRIAMVDESRVEALPEECKYTLYLVPRDGTKEKLVHRVYSQSLAAAGRTAQYCRLYYAGDTLTDLKTGLYAGGRSVLYFLLPSGSRLAPYIMEERRSYGAQDLSYLWGRASATGRKRLVKTEQHGVYCYETGIPGFGTNIIVIGDVRYSGTTPPGSVAEFLEEFLVKDKRAGC